MSSPVPQRSQFIRLLDAFFQEENIKWVLGLGVSILLGSSLRLVTLHWVEYTPVWKYLILVAYSAAVFGLSQFGYHRMGLRKTGTVLMSLSVLLTPVSFLALHWVQPESDRYSINAQPALLGLLGLNLVWSTFICHRIFRHFLRGTQFTFLICYLTLCVAGAVVPGLPSAWSPILALFLWAVFAIGTVKVNRHVFWLTEEYRLPRIFGFFPIALLGSQFVTVFVLGLAQQMTPSLLGLICTLVSLPVLLTADAVARAFEQRTGGLVRPIPWSISGPLVLGTVLSASGVILALTGWPTNSIIVPTAIVAAISMGVIASRTQKAMFVWAMIVCILIAYQTCPVLVKELVLRMRDQVAAAVKESRLPYAFYGLTYAPLIIVFSMTASALLRRGQTLFAHPMKVVATFLSLVLLPVSFTHPSAVFPVSAILCPLFLLQAVLFGQRLYVIAAAVAWLTAAYGAPEFVSRVLDWHMASSERLFAWTVASACLLFPGVFVDQWAQKRCETRTSTCLQQDLNRICQLFGLGSTVVAAIAWAVRTNFSVFSVGLDASTATPVLISLLLLVHALRWLKPGLGEFALSFITFAVHFTFMHGDIVSIPSVELLTGLLLTQWGFSYLLAVFPLSRFGRAFGDASFHVSFAGLSILFTRYGIEWIANHFVPTNLHWSLSTILMAWALDFSRRANSRHIATIAWCSLIIFISTAFTSSIGLENASPWWMTIWATTGLGLLGLRRLVLSGVDRSDSEQLRAPSQRAYQLTNWTEPLSFIAPILFLILSILSFSCLGYPSRTAGILALCGLLLTEKGQFRQVGVAVVAPFLNWHVIAAFIAWATGRSGMIFEITEADLASCGLSLAALAAISVWAFETRLRRSVPFAEILAVHELILMAVCFSLLGAAIHWGDGVPWSAQSIASAAIACASLAAAAFTSALRDQDEERAWLAQGVLFGTVIYFSLAGVLDLKQSYLMYAALVAGLGQWMIGGWMSQGTRSKVLTYPLRSTGFALPLLILPLALFHEFSVMDATWVGANCLPLLGAAAFYFWNGLERRHVPTVTLSAVFLNLAFVLLWKNLSWTDPQLFLMPIGISLLIITELMNKEIPAENHTQLRLIGSLTILVSPTFHIVTGSWSHILMLMVASVAVALLAIALRSRVLLYTGTAFLVADLVALVARSSIDEPNVLWITGVALGTSIVALGAICENHRETVLARVRSLAAELEQWS